MNTITDKVKAMRSPALALTALFLGSFSATWLQQSATATRLSLTPDQLEFLDSIRMANTIGPDTGVILGREAQIVGLNLALVGAGGGPTAQSNL